MSFYFQLYFCSCTLNSCIFTLKTRVYVQNFIILARIQTCIKLYCLKFQNTSRNKMDFSILFCQYKHTFHLDFWLCACAFSTLTTIFCSSIRKARLILKGKKPLGQNTSVTASSPSHVSGPLTCHAHTWRTWSLRRLCWRASWSWRASWGPEV